MIAHNSSLVIAAASGAMWLAVLMEGTAVGEHNGGMRGLLNAPSLDEQGRAGTAAVHWMSRADSCRDNWISRVDWSCFHCYLVQLYK